MAKELSYINTRKTYVVDSDGGVVPDSQDFYPGQVIEDAYVSHNITVAENFQNNLYHKFGYKNHSYYTYSANDSAYVVETEDGSESNCMAVGLPQYLAGWQTEGGIVFNWGGGIATQEFLDTFFGDSTTLDLYAIWQNTNFIRVIISTFDGKANVYNGTFNVEISDTASYGGSPISALSPMFKTTYDFSNIQRHLTLKINGVEDADYREAGTGHGCPSTISNVKYPTYYGFKSNTNLTIDITTTNEDYIPEYASSGNGNVMYNGYVFNNGLSRDFCDTQNIPTGWFFWELNLISQAPQKWRASISNVSGDKTLFVKLVRKPEITATVVNGETGNIEITDTTDTPEDIQYDTKSVKALPGDMRVCWASPSTGYMFDGWYSDFACTTPLPNDSVGNSYRSTQYTINPVIHSWLLYAKFVPYSGYTITYFKEKLN